MLTGLALNLTKDGWGIIQTNTLSAQSWDGELYDGGIFGPNPNWEWTGDEWIYHDGNSDGYNDTSDIDNGLGDDDDTTDDPDDNNYDNGLSDSQDGDDNSNIDYQKYLLEGVDKLDGLHFGRGDDENVNRYTMKFYDENYWTCNPYPNLSLVLNNNMSPSEGVISIFNTPEKYSFDCAEFVQVLIWYAKMETMGENAFNNYIGENMELHQDYSTGIESKTKYTRESPNNRFEKAVNLSEGYTFDNYSNDYRQNNEMVVDLERELSDLPIGSRVCLENLAAPKGAAFQRENIIKVGDDQWAAHPYSQQGQTYSLSEIIDMFAREFNSDTSNIYVKEIEKYK